MYNNNALLGCAALGYSCRPKPPLAIWQGARTGKFQSSPAGLGNEEDPMGLSWSRWNALFIAMCSFARPFSIEDAMENGSPYSVQKLSLQEFPFSPDISRVNLMSQRTSRMGARKGFRNCQYRLCSRPRGLPEPVFSSSLVQSAIPLRILAAN